MNRTNATYHLTTIAKCTSFIAFVFACTMAAQSTDLIIFSYNRPLQLYALLESIDLHMIGLNKIFVIGRADDDNYRTAYDQVAHDFPIVIFKWQGKDPRADFKPLTLECLHATDCPYVMFAVDDDIVKDAVDCDDCIHWLEKTGAFGFFLRLGLHLRHCYCVSCAPQELPPLRQLSNNILTWHFKDAHLEWAYQTTVDMTIFRKENVIPPLQTEDYSSPNLLELRWQRYADTKRFGLCYSTSKIVNIPLNLVQQNWNSIHMEGYSPQYLLELFNSGKRLDISALYRIINPSTHTEIEPKFVAYSKSVKR